MTSRMPERARTDLREPQGSNPLGPPGPELPPAATTPRQELGMVSPELPHGVPGAPSSRSDPKSRID